MAQVNLSNYKNIYLQTAREYINSMFLSCDKLAINFSDREALNNLHISSHSLKSQSQVMGFTDIANVCLNIEKISNDVLIGNSELNNEIIANINRSVEEAKEMLKQVQHDN